MTVGAVLGAGSCTDNNLPSAPTGKIEITTATSGPDPDRDGYAITIDDGAETTVATNAARELDLEPGRYSVRLTETAPNCTVAGENPRTITVTAGETTTVSFQVTCGGLTGSLEIATATSGPSPDLDGYIVTLDGKDRLRLGGSGAATFNGLIPGHHAVGLRDVAANCQIPGDNPRTVTVRAGASTTVAFTISCSA
jgi:hypothetical protein